MKILLYQGVSTISRLIRWQTRSKYSHAAVLLDDGTVIEAWHKGVTHSETISTLHAPGTIVDVFELHCDFDNEKATKFAFEQLGKGYDFTAILRFISRRDEPKDNRWFCSELVLAICDIGGCPLLSNTMPHSHLSPRDIGLSTRIRYLYTVVTI